MTWGPTPWTGLTPARPEATPARPDITLARNPTSGLTPAQAHGHPNFVTDVPVQGPTDEGMRAASCWWAQNRLPAQPHCVDCQEKGNVMVPGWSRSSMACPGCGMLGEAVSFGGRRARGFAVGGPSDPDIFDALNAAQQIWVRDALNTLNKMVTTTTGTTCATWADPGLNLAAAVGCFQSWYNANYGAAAVQGGVTLRSDGAIDADTLSALQTVAGAHPSDFTAVYPPNVGNQVTPTPGVAPTPAPAPATPAPTPAPTTAVTKPGLSTGAMVGIGVAAAGVVGLGIYAATSGGGKRRRRRR